MLASLTMAAQMSGPLENYPSILVTPARGRGIMPRERPRAPAGSVHGAAAGADDSQGSAPLAGD